MPKRQRRGASASQSGPPFLMVSNRNKETNGLGKKLASKPAFFECPSDKDPTRFSSWTEIKSDDFQKRLIGLAENFDQMPEDQNEAQQHVTLFVHGFNVEWQEAVKRYAQIKADLFDRSDLGVLILFTWPSNGRKLPLLPLRQDSW